MTGYGAESRCPLCSYCVPGVDNCQDGLDGSSTGTEMARTTQRIGQFALRKVLHALPLPKGTADTTRLPLLKGSAATTHFRPRWCRVQNPKLKPFEAQASLLTFLAAQALATLRTNSPRLWLIHAGRRARSSLSPHSPPPTLRRRPTPAEGAWHHSLYGARPGRRSLSPAISVAHATLLIALASSV